MSVIYRRKWLLYLITGLVFASFMQTGLLEEMAACRPGASGVACQQLLRPSEEPSPEYRFPDQAEDLLAPRMRETGPGKQPGQGRYQLYRFLTVVADILLFPDLIFRMVVRRFGFRMIEVWQEISYIHRSDGEKENVLLNMEWNHTLHMTGGILHAEKQNRRQGQNFAD